MPASYEESFLFSRVTTFARNSTQDPLAVSAYMVLCSFLQFPSPPLEPAILPRTMPIHASLACYPHGTVTVNTGRFFHSLYVTFMHSRAARFASCVSVDGPLIPDCSVPLRVSQLTKLSTVDSPLQIKRHQHQ